MSIFGSSSNTTDPVSNEPPSGSEISIGPMILGMSFDLILYGFAINQTFVYFSRSSYRDRTITKVLVGWSMLIGTITTILSIYYTWDAFVLGFGDRNGIYLGSLDKLSWFGALDVLLIVPIQAFYILKIYRILPIPLGTLILLAPFLLSVASGGIGWTVVMKQGTAREIANPTVWQYLWNCSTLAVDFFISLTILFALYKTHSWGTHKDALVYRFTRITLEVMILPTIVASGTFLTYIIDHDTLVNFFWMFQAKIYLVSVLALLNSRTGLRVSTTEGSSQESGTIPEIRTFPLDEVTLKTDRIETSEINGETPAIDRKRFSRLQSTEAIVDTVPVAETVKAEWRHPKRIDPTITV